MDNDGDVEIACYACAGFFPTSVFRIVVYDLPSLYNPLLMDWPVIQHDARRTGCYSAPTFSRNGVVDGSANRAPLAELVGFMLSSPCPNPFNSETEFTLVLTQGMEVSLIIYDIQGREIAALIDGWREAGTHRITFNGAELASGLYFAHFKAGNYEKTEKMMFLK
jgi:hypothetical protein